MTTMAAGETQAAQGLDASVPNPQRIMEMAWAFAAPLMLEAAIKNRVFDVLDEGPKDLAGLAAATEASQRGLRALCDALVGFDFLTRDDNGYYALTAESTTFLVSTKPTFQGFLLRHISTQLIPNWLGLKDRVRTGQPAARVNEEADGAPFFSAFVADLYPMSAPAANGLAEALDIPAASAPLHVLDIAAGSGVWGITLAKHSPQVHVTAVDWPGVLPITRSFAEREGVTPRLTTLEGDILEVDLPAGHFHIATLGHILHSEGEARSRKLLQRMFDALVSGGTIAIAEFVVDDDRRGPVGPLIFALNMLVNTEQGDAFTFAEMSNWLTDCGFVNPRQLPAPGPSPLILATKP